MPRYSLELLDGRSVEYGLDLSVEAEWFADVLGADGRIMDSFDASHASYDHVRPVRSLLLFIGSVGDLWDEDDVGDTTTRLVSSITADLPERLQGLGEVIENLRRAANEERHG